MGTVQWEAEPDTHDYPAAASYLSLVGTATQVADLVTRLRGAPVEHYKAKDILRSAALPLLPPCRRGPEEGEEGQAALTGPARPR